MKIPQQYVYLDMAVYNDKGRVIASYSSLTT